MVTKSYVKYTMLIEYAARIFVIFKKTIIKLLFVVACLLLRMSDSEKILTIFIVIFGYIN